MTLRHCERGAARKLSALADLRTEQGRAALRGLVAQADIFSQGYRPRSLAATGFNHAKGEAAGAAGPKELPMQILDHVTGCLMAFGVRAAPGGAACRDPVGDPGNMGAAGGAARSERARVAVTGLTLTENSVRPAVFRLSGAVEWHY